MRRLMVMDRRRSVRQPRRASMSWEGDMKTLAPRTRRGAQRNRGFSAILSMLYMTMFGALAVGFSASINTSVQVSENDHRTANAQLASETGLDFMHYHLANILLPAGTPQSQILPTVAAGLSSRLNGTRNMRTRIVGYT